MAFIGGLLLGFFVGVAVSCVLLAKRDIKREAVNNTFDNMSDSFMQSLNTAKATYNACLSENEEDLEDISEEE